MSYLAATTGDLHDIGLLILDTALRKGEMFGLEWPDIRLEPVRARNSKNSKSRNLPPKARVLQMLKRRAGLKLDGLVFLRTSSVRFFPTPGWRNRQKHRT